MHFCYEKHKKQLSNSKTHFHDVSHSIKHSITNSCCLTHNAYLLRMPSFLRIAFTVFHERNCSIFLLTQNNEMLVLFFSVLLCKKELRFGMQWQSNPKVVKTFKSNLQRLNFAKNKGNYKENVYDSIFDINYSAFFLPVTWTSTKNRNWLCAIPFLKIGEVITKIFWHVICIISKVILQI